MRCQLSEKEIRCPIPAAEDRLLECFYFLSQVEMAYHNPREFRYSLNAFLSALSAVSTIVQKEIEKKGDIVKWNEIRKPYKDDQWLNGIKRARNVTLHQKSIFNGSKTSIGLFRGRRLKLAYRKEIPGDITSAEILEVWTNSEAGRMFLDDEHSAIGEQYGVQRQYWIREISNSEDVLMSIRRAIIRAHDLLIDAHKMYDMDIKGISDDCLKPEELAKINVLLEGDLDPTLYKKWGW